MNYIYEMTDNHHINLGPLFSPFNNFLSKQIITLSCTFCLGKVESLLWFHLCLSGVAIDTLQK